MNPQTIATISCQCIGMVMGNTPGTEEQNNTYVATFKADVASRLNKECFLGRPTVQFTISNLAKPLFQVGSYYSLAFAEEIPTAQVGGISVKTAKMPESVQKSITEALELGKAEAQASPTEPPQSI